jgi:hypothetical protein
MPATTAKTPVTKSPKNTAKQVAKQAAKPEVAKMSPVRPDVTKTSEETANVEKARTFSPEEISFMQQCIEEETCRRITGADHLSFYLTRSHVPAEVREATGYQDGLVHRLRDVMRLNRMVARSHRDPVDYKDKNGVDRTISARELRAMENELYNELKRLPQRLEGGLKETSIRNKQREKEQRIEKKVQDGVGLLTIRKEILEAMRGSIGKSAILGETETKKTRTGLHNVQHFKFTGQNLDAALAIFKKSLPTVRSNVINLLMRYMSEKGITLGVGKRGDIKSQFSMPKEFVDAFKKVVGKKPVDVDVEKMVFSDIQKMISLICEPFSGKLSEKDKEEILTDISLVDFARAAVKQAKEQTKA